MVWKTYIRTLTEKGANAELTECHKRHMRCRIRKLDPNEHPPDKYVVEYEVAEEKPTPTKAEVTPALKVELPRVGGVKSWSEMTEEERFAAMWEEGFTDWAASAAKYRTDKATLKAYWSEHSGTALPLDWSDLLDFSFTGGLVAMPVRMTAREVVARGAAEVVKKATRESTEKAVLEVMRQLEKAGIKMTTTEIQKKIESKLIQEAIEQATRATGLAAIAEALKKPKTLVWALGGLLGALSMAYGVSFGVSWFAKEGLIEQIVMPLSDRMRNWRYTHDEETKKLILRDVEKLEQVLPRAEALINAVAWLWPLTAQEWKEYATTARFELEQIKAELGAAALPRGQKDVKHTTAPTIEKEWPVVRVTTNAPETSIYVGWKRVGTANPGRVFEITSSYHKFRLNQDYVIIGKKRGWRRDEKVVRFTNWGEVAEVNLTLVDI